MNRLKSEQQLINIFTKIFGTPDNTIITINKLLTPVMSF